MASPADLARTLAAAQARHRSGDLAGARELYRRAAGMVTEAGGAADFAATYGLGVTACGLGDFAEGLEALQKAVGLRPDSAPALEDLGRVLEDLRRADLAIPQLERAVAIDPRRIGAWLSLARCRLATQRREEALDASRRAIALAPRNLRARCNLTMCLLRTGRHREAEEAGLAALDLDPRSAVALSNLGAVRREMGDFAGAEALFRQATIVEPDFAAGHLNLALTLFLQGRWAEGWPEYEWRLREPSARADRGFAQPQWRGEALAGRTLLVHAEQGHGDTLNFARYVLFLARFGGRVVLEVQPGLKGLLAGAPGIERLLARGEDLPPFDLHIPLPALPRVFATTPATIPAMERYISPAPGKAAAWAERLASDRRPRVGVVWAGSPTHGDDHYRSIPLETLRPVFDVPGPVFYSLQVGARAGDPARLGLGGRLRDLSHLLTDYNETAAAIAQLDLVIAVDTSVAHLAGAMGKPTWMLLARVPDWRWLADGETTRWYPSMRLFRQQRMGVWQPIVDRLAAALAEPAR